MTDASPDSGSQPLRLGSPTIRTITAFQAELTQQFDDFGRVQIDGGTAERVDTAAVQLLAAFVRDLRADGRNVEWTACSPALLRAARMLGLAAALGLEPAADAAPAST